MKYVIILGDGMADEPLAELGGQTPLEYADTPAMDALAPLSELGQVHTIPEGMKPGSDVANLAVLGYDPRHCYSGRSPLEALSIGVPMKETDIAIRANLVTLSDDEVPYEQKTILDHSSDEIATSDASVLLDALKAEFDSDTYRFYLGTSYRHLLIWNGGEAVDLVQPHDVLGQVIGPNLPQDETLRYMMKRSHEILDHHPINEARRAAGLHPANSLWFWGAGTKPQISNFEEKTGKKGAMISAVDLLKGIAVGAGMTNISVEGADGTLETNYEGKAEAAVKALLEDGFDFAYVHLEAPDEMGHQGSIPKKVKAIEYLDQRVIRIVREKLDASGEPYRLMILPDHPTPICIRTHTSNPVPYLLYDSTAPGQETWKYNEREAKASGRYVAEGYKLIDHLFEK